MPTPSRWGRLALVGAMVAALSGCSVLQATVPEDVLETHPVKHPVRALTAFSEGLTCLGRVLKAEKVEPIYLALTQIPDHSESPGSAGRGTNEMLISAISRLSEETGLVRLVAYDRATPNVIALHNAHPNKKNLRIPDFFIRGAITQIETSPYSKQHGSSLSLGTGILSDLLGAGVSNSNSVTMKSIALDLNIGLVSTYQILPGVTSTNTMSVLKDGDSTELNISFDKVGGIYSVNENRADALSTALRSLVEVGVVELVGKLYNADYAPCLARLDRSSPEYVAARDNYDEMSGDERLEYILAFLKNSGAVKDEDGTAIVDGVASPALREAITSYRVRNDLFPSAIIDFRIYEKMYLQAMSGPDGAKPGEGVGPIKRWLKNEDGKT